MNNIFRPSTNIETIKEHEIYRDNRHLYRAQICRIEGNLFVGFTLFFFDFIKGDWCPTRKNFHFPISVWPAFVEAFPHIDIAVTELSIKKEPAGILLIQIYLELTILFGVKYFLTHIKMPQM